MLSTTQGWRPQPVFIFQFPIKTHTQKPSQGTSYLVNNQVRGPFPTLWMTRSQKLKWSQIMLNVESPDGYCEKGRECHLPPSSWVSSIQACTSMAHFLLKTLSLLPETKLCQWFLRHDIQTDSKLKMQKYIANMLLPERINLIQIIAWVGSNDLNIKGNHLKIPLLGKRKLLNLMKLL